MRPPQIGGGHTCACVPKSGPARCMRATPKTVATHTLLCKGLILLLIFPVIVLVLVIVLLQCLPSSSVQSYRINIAKAL